MRLLVGRASEGLATVRVIAVHSNRGGTGKSLIAVNLAAAYASLGRDICLFDLDFRAPSLSTIFKIDRADHWTNDYVAGHCKVEDLVIDITQRFSTKGRFLVGLANPDLDAIREITGKDRKWQMKSLRRLLSMKTGWLEKNTQYAIFDSSPGVYYSSVNAVVSSDVTVVVTTLNKLDIKGTRRMMDQLYRSFDKRAMIVMNKVTPILLDGWKNELDNLTKELKTMFDWPILAVLPCFCDILQDREMRIYVLEKPEHAFSVTIFKIAERDFKEGDIISFKPLIAYA